MPNRWLRSVSEYLANDVHSLCIEAIAEIDARVAIFGTRAETNQKTGSRAFGRKNDVTRPQLVDVEHKIGTSLKSPLSPFVEPTRHIACSESQFVIASRGLVACS
jgi:hypothetical protein